MALFFSIICATYLVVCFKYFQQFGIKNLPAIVFNYITCVCTGLMMTNTVPDSSIIYEPWFPVAATLGCCFFCIFNVMGFVARNIGLTMTSVSSKLSMVIPVSVAILFYDQQFTVIKAVAIGLAIVAVILTSERSTDSAEAEAGKPAIAHPATFMHSKTFGVLMALIIFLGSGLNDSLVNFASEKLMDPGDFNNFNIVIFSFASLSGITVLLFRFFSHRELPAPKAILGGILLGIPNYFSLLFLIEALNFPGWASSVIFPVNNMGIVILTAVAAVILFREKLSILNWAGMGIAIVSIALLIFA